MLSVPRTLKTVESTRPLPSLPSPSSSARNFFFTPHRPSGCSLRSALIPSFSLLALAETLLSLSHSSAFFVHPSSSSSSVLEKKMDGAAITRDSSAYNSCNYSDSSYWNKRYADDPKPFDWYQCYAGVCPLVRRFIPLASRVLMVGCGNAVMSEDMVKDGYKDVVNIDISPVVIEAMQKKYFNVPQLKYITMNALDLSSFDDCTFEAVIDKGTLDSIMCGMGAPCNAAIMLTEISRVLKPNGVYMLITYGDPRLRMPHLSRNVYGWSISLFIIPQPGSRKAQEGCLKAYTEPVLLHDDGTFADKSSLEEVESHYVYVCRKEA